MKNSKIQIYWWSKTVQRLPLDLSNVIFKFMHSSHAMFKLTWLQVGGGLTRWMLCHHIFVLEKAVIRLPWSGSSIGDNAETPGSLSWHLFNPYLSWIVPTLLKLLENLQALYTPQVADLLLFISSVLSVSCQPLSPYINLFSFFSYQSSWRPLRISWLQKSLATVFTHWLPSTCYVYCSYVCCLLPLSACMLVLQQEQYSI